MNAVTDFSEFSLTKRTSLLAVPGVHPHAGSGRYGVRAPTEFTLRRMPFRKKGFLLK